MTVCTEVTHSILAIPSCPAKITHLSTQQNTDSCISQSTFSPETSREESSVWNPGGSVALQKLGYCTSQVYGIGNLESMVRSLLVWLDSNCKVLYQHLSQRTDCSIFPSRELFQAGKSYLCSFHSVVQGDPPLHQCVANLVFLPNDRPLTICTAFKHSFHFSLNRVKLSNTFYIRCGSQAFSWCAIFL